VCSVLLLRRYEARKRPTAVSWFMTPRLQKENSEGRARPAKLWHSKLATLLAVPGLVFLAGGAMAQAQEIAPPILSSGLPDATHVQALATEKLRQLPPTEPPLDAASLPSIESLGPGSDIRPFLATGVAPDLTRAALRRAWSTDPAIRDFIGLSENSWDLNTQDGVPGFSSLTTD